MVEFPGCEYNDAKLRWLRQLPREPTVVLSEPMSGLSNFLRWRNVPEPTGPVTIRPVLQGETDAALRLVLGSNGLPADDATVQDFAGFATHRRIDLARMQVAATRAGLVAACLPVVSPGKTALVMISAARASSTVAKTLARCVDAACADLASRSIVLAQLLLEVTESRAADAMREVRFEDLAVLLYLQRTIHRNPARPPIPAGCELHTFNARTYDLFARAITASYEQSLDCPLLHGQRDIADTIAGHQAAGEFDPSLWFCLTENKRELGVLLLSPIPSHHSMELVYIGLAPEARGRKIGDFFVQLGFHLARERGLTTFALAVDEHNHPAVRLYYRHGLGEVNRRRAMLRKLI